MKNEHVFTRPEPMIGQLSAFITAPSDHDPAAERLPVVVFLHGAGESGESTPETLPVVHAHGIAKYFGADADYKGLRAITISPQCPRPRPSTTAR